MVANIRISDGCSWILRNPLDINNSYMRAQLRVPGYLAILGQPAMGRTPEEGVPRPQTLEAEAGRPRVITLPRVLIHYDVGGETPSATLRLRCQIPSHTKDMSPGLYILEIDAAPLTQEETSPNFLNAPATCSSLRSSATTLTSLWSTG